MIVNFALFVVQLLPPHWRKQSVVALFRSAVVSVSYCQDLLDAYRKATMYELQHTSQRCYLRGALNDAIDPYQGRIVVDDIEPIDLFVCYAENEPIDIDIDANTTCYSSSIAGVSSVSFKVSIPSVLYDSDEKKRTTIYNQAVSIVRKYKTIGRSFVVEFV